MKFLPLILRNLRRNRRRTALTTAGIGLSVFVVTALLAVEAGFAALSSAAGDSLLNVYEKGVACPVSSRVFDGYLSKIGVLPHVDGATGVLRGLYSYRDKENLVLVAGVDYASFRKVKSIVLREGSEAEFLARGDGALVGARLADRHGWRVGQTVSLREDRLTFHVSGIFDTADTSHQGGVLLHKSFLARVKRDEGRSTYLIVKVSDPAAVASVSRSIDDTFANFPKPTKTQSEQAAREEELKDFVELRWMLSGMLLATIVASVFGAANSVSMAVRERAREIGVLRSLGLRRGQIFEIVLGESALVALAGGAIGLVASSALVATGKSLGGYVPLILGPGHALAGIGIALLIGLLGALVPAIGASRVRIVEALRIVD